MPEGACPKGETYGVLESSRTPPFCHAKRSSTGAGGGDGMFCDGGTRARHCGGTGIKEFGWVHGVQAGCGQDAGGGARGVGVGHPSTDKNHPTQKPVLLATSATWRWPMQPENATAQGHRTFTFSMKIARPKANFGVGMLRGFVRWGEGSMGFCCTPGAMKPRAGRPPEPSSDGAPTPRRSARDAMAAKECLQRTRSTGGGGAVCCRRPRRKGRATKQGQRRVRTSFFPSSPHESAAIKTKMVSMRRGAPPACCVCLARLCLPQGNVHCPAPCICMVWWVYSVLLWGVGAPLGQTGSL